MSSFKLDIHDKAVPIHLEDFSADRFHFHPINLDESFTGRTAPIAHPSPTGNPIPLTIAIPSLTLSKRAARPDFLRLTPPPTPLSHGDFLFLERVSSPPEI
ncbi:hypothetical protein AVEN_142332-1 [Araneus ventricosus]|uniref:Uncharacterized protein n=1 Tax=Araneus ventricosus TaxID=182803 RepID=A0A4Y2T6S6_ARAVE|nr:hypothetical protein AVEN_142332-1 [Araneus ventricosus]